MKSHLHILTLVAGGLAGLAVFFVFNTARKPDVPYAANATAYAYAAGTYVLPISEPSFIPVLKSDSVDRPAIGAKSALIYDTKSGRELYEKNFDERLPIASLTKILSAIVVLENVNQQDVIIVPREAVKADGEKQDLYVNERLSVEKLLEIMLVESSNDAAYALRWYVQQKGIDFVRKMSEKAAAIGMLNSQFLDPAGLDDNAFSTAQDMAKLTAYSLQYEKIWNILKQKELMITSEDGAIAHTVKSTNQLLGVIPDIVGGKTGYTDGALGCMILIVDTPGGGDKLISIVLGSQDRFGETKKILNWATTAYRWK